MTTTRRSAQLRAAQALAAEIGNAQRLAEAEAALAEVAGGRRGPARSARTTARPLRTQPGNLTGRQAEVLRLLAAGLSNKQIAAELYLSTATVERHLATIYRNLGLARPGRGGQVRDQPRHRGSRPGVIAARLVIALSRPAGRMAGRGPTTFPKCA